jgi:glycosyltransferase involved in cell wall biosynthesis
MLVYYISPSTVPSRSANSIHVINMCEGLVQLGYKVVLFARSDNSIKIESNKFIDQFYGINSDDIDLNRYSSKTTKGIELFIAIFAFVKFLIDSSKGLAPQIIISRNIYASLLFGLLLRKKVIYETHSPEFGFRKKIQKMLLSSSKIYTVVISNALKRIICKSHSLTNGERIYIFHDAAREGFLKLNNLERKAQRKKVIGRKIDLRKYKKFIGYFGHLYSGRGIELIRNIAKKNPKYAFLVYGGNEKEIKKCKEDNSIENLFIMGYISPNLVHCTMEVMDILLMPYQKSVSVGVEGVDTAGWMSPMKMFEYMSTGVPIVSSDLQVLREVLVNSENCLLVKPDDINEWSNAVQQIAMDVDLAKKIGNNAYSEYSGRYNWKYRAACMINLLS